MAHAHIGNYDQAIADYNQAIILKPDLAETYYNRGNAYNTIGNKVRAIADFQKTLELNVDSKLRAKATDALKKLGKQKED